MFDNPKKTVFKKRLPIKVLEDKAYYVIKKKYMEKNYRKKVYKVCEHFKLYKLFFCALEKINIQTL